MLLCSLCSDFVHIIQQTYSILIELNCINIEYIMYVTNELYKYEMYFLARETPHPLYPPFP